MNGIINFFTGIRTQYHDFITLGASLFGFLTPGLLYVITGCTAESISAYQYESPILLLVLILIMAAGFFTGTPRYQLSGLFLLGLGIINLDVSVFLHNVVVGLFFIHTTRIITIDKRLWGYALPIYLAILFWAGGAIDMYTFEVIAIICISLFSANYSILKLRAVEFRLFDNIKTMKRTLIQKK